MDFCNTPSEHHSTKQAIISGHMCILLLEDSLLYEGKKKKKGSETNKKPLPHLSST